MSSFSKTWMQNAELYSGAPSKTAPKRDSSGEVKKEKKRPGFWRRLFRRSKG
jgi:hypothetical protein